MSGAWWRKQSFQATARMVASVAIAGVFAAGCSATDGPGPEDGADGGMMSESAMSGASSLDQFEATGEVAAGGPFQEVHFPFDSIELDPAAQGAVKANAEYLGANPDVRVEIEGHCDERGTSEYNLALGARRSKSVRDALVAEGVAASRLSTVSYGEELPVCRDADDGCWLKNRRAHLVDLTP